ncbi:hypothetical protein [Planobispora rosea]|uniref:Uncharacterized protein n=2 Tax=Planobispora rosea TaxID=35762 RepID=A0A8J3S453_PLARO|nr:hypothetical protein [Planobispora rosea]GIH86475.1 hypothetical protein Pro02_48830 [Planobispora rosea]
MFIKCGNCHRRHSSIAAVRACSQGSEISSCSWLVDTGHCTEDGEAVIVECGADSWTTDRGWRCATGHSHVPADIRYQEGWDYVTADEAAGFANETGRLPVLMNGHP